MAADKTPCQVDQSSPTTIVMTAQDTLEPSPMYNQQQRDQPSKATCTHKRAQTEQDTIQPSSTTKHLLLHNDMEQHATTNSNARPNHMSETLHAMEQDEDKIEPVAMSKRGAIEQQTVVTTRCATRLSGSSSITPEHGAKHGQSRNTRATTKLTSIPCRLQIRAPRPDKDDVAEANVEAVLTSNLDTMAAVACQVADSATHHLAKRKLDEVASASSPKRVKREQEAAGPLATVCGEASKHVTEVGKRLTEACDVGCRSVIEGYGGELRMLREYVMREIEGLHKRMEAVENEVREAVRGWSEEGRGSTPVSSCSREEERRGKRRRDNWTASENADFLRLVRMNVGMEEMQLRRMLAKFFAPRRSHEQCANHLRILRAQKKVPAAVGEAVAYRVRGRGE